MPDFKPFAGIAKDSTIVSSVGQAGDGAALPAKATGILGWLRNIYDALTRQPNYSETGLMLTGNPEGDYANADILGLLMDTGSGESMNVRVVNPPKQDAAGFQMVSDAPKEIAYQGGSIGPGPLIDTTGYQSIVVSFTAAAGTYLFQTSNDPQQLTAGVANALGSSSGGGSLPTSSVAATAAMTYVFPVTGKFFRVYCSVAGTSSPIITQLRAGPMPPLLTQQQTQGVGAVGAAAGGNPFTMAGVDNGGLVRRFATDINGVVSMGGSLPVGFTYGVYNAQFSNANVLLKSQTAAQSTFNPVLLGGLDPSGVARFFQTNTMGQLLVRDAPPAQGEPGKIELLQQIVTAGRASVYLLTRIEALLRGLQDPRTDEEVDDILTAFSEPRGNIPNINN